jgi:peroxiredoxin (alkyl hydroperoxide reductase subunit C)
LAPAFIAETTNGTISFPDDLGKKWKILFSHPLDFTPVCSSEIMELAKLQEEFSGLDVSILVISTDTHSQHLAWKDYLERLMAENGEDVKISFPLIEDHKARISRQYGMLDKNSNNTRNVRGVFIINPDNIIKAIYFYPVSTGRNLDEMVRTVKALQMNYYTHLYSPVNWKPGDDLIVPYTPYLPEDLALNPNLANDYYLFGHFMWFRKADSLAPLKQGN